MKFNATSRSVQGTSASRRLRREGRVPAIVYGGTAAPLNIELDHNEIFHALRKEEFHASILTMAIEGSKSEQVLLRSVQWHAYKQQVLHVDFQRVDANQALHTKVPLHFINADISPAVKLSGNIISHPITEVEVTCLPANLPQFIEVDLKDLLGGGVVHLSAVKLPLGVTFTSHGSDDPVIVSAVSKGGPAADEGDAEAPAA
ncbi:50S ribosomal protein L25/general stress protein Ctc [Bordetella genomosp. 1]|uniref:Large ribosomal subunit protein bL25 n=1 Tax=Bordetella genomosp. 1 TaxID=1395607 RepID=A0A261RWU8_9BORD|nr:50S ribosomal protein L25/general stress protein Ctc [Bordetella genomosp. 1]MDQ8032492.1 50S ribosomal protein L25/general stress protein Ctc [Bordetella sp.]OZI28753.1 50S ribosomal protein L25/general stress protein Ctc [Bordetella genomosp. 1]OZI55811.1 50S ribosomal protein L25/general stress protein Ctc [Bordetella genomosp. 1]